MARVCRKTPRRSLFWAAVVAGSGCLVLPGRLQAAAASPARPGSEGKGASTTLDATTSVEATTTGSVSSPIPQLSAQQSERRLTSEESQIPNISAELGIGLLALPNADVCVQRAAAGCARGDQSLELNAWPLFRATRYWSFGAGLTFALFPSAEAPRIDPEDVPRSHTRQYFLAEGTVRYYPVSENDFELWLGPTLGLVVVSDTFTSKVDQPDLVQVGPTTGVNLFTEAPTAGGALGVSFAFSRHWKLGLYARGQIWFLPDEPATSPTLDEASLTHNVAVLDFGVSIGFSTSRY